MSTEPTWAEIGQLKDRGAELRRQASELRGRLAELQVHTAPARGLVAELERAAKSVAVEIQNLDGRKTFSGTPIAWLGQAPRGPKSRRALQPVPVNLDDPTALQRTADDLLKQAHAAPPAERLDLLGRAMTAKLDADEATARAELARVDDDAKERARLELAALTPELEKALEAARGQLDSADEPLRGLRSEIAELAAKADALDEKAKRAECQLLGVDPDSVAEPVQIVA